MEPPHTEEAAAAAAGGAEGGSASPGTGLEGPMLRLGLDGGGEGEDGELGAGEEADTWLPERPGEADCGYYLRTGACGFGERCRYNHPRDRGGTEFGGGAKNGAAQYFPERQGQPVCEYYLKTGTCKFGSNCKYHHPKQDGSVQSVILNNNGFPLRPGEKECSYYMKTGQCKFGSTCKFHHPEFGGIPVTRSSWIIYSRLIHSNGAPIWNGSIARMEPLSGTGKSCSIRWSTTNYSSWTIIWYRTPWIFHCNCLWWYILAILFLNWTIEQ
uniref:C3H1-type domain-containing protein n=1 Tax=Zea mays TaxID=4577 RepID=A0A804N1N0_MAIZE